MRPFLTLCTLAALLAASTALLVASTSEAAWTQIQSANFLFLGDAPPADMRRVAQRFEQFHLAMQQLVSRDAFTTSAPTVVLVLKNRESLQRFVPLYNGEPVVVGGLASTSSEFNYIAIDASGDDGFAIVFHELTHVLTNNVWSKPAPWYSEGISEYYSTFDLRSETVVRMGAPISRHIALLRQRMMPVRELLSITDVQPLLDEGNRSNIFYAQSWALVHLLMNRDPERKGVARYKALSEKGVSQEEAVTTAFGLDVVTLEKELNRYVHQLALTAMQWKLPTAVTTDALVANPIAEGLAAPHLAHMQFRARRYDEAEQRAIAALSAAPRSATANAVMAALHLHQERLDEAWAALSAEHAYDDFFDHYLIASLADDYLRAVGRDGMHAVAAQKMFRQHSLAAAQLRPHVPQAWHFVAQAHARLEELDDATTAIERALRMAPANERYRFTFAEVLARKQEFARSRGVLGLLMAYGRSDVVRGEARRLMGEVARYERAVELAAAASAPPPVMVADVDPTATSTPPTDVDASRTAKMIPVFRDVEAGETRLFGTLQLIECRRDGVTLQLDVEGRPRRVTTADFKQIEFITYRADLQGGVGCGPRNTIDRVYLTWRGTDGEATEINSPFVVVEFTPLGFVPK